MTYKRVNEPPQKLYVARVAGLIQTFAHTVCNARKRVHNVSNKRQPVARCLYIERVCMYVCICVCMCVDYKRFCQIFSCITSKYTYIRLSCRMHVYVCRLAIWHACTWGCVL